MKGTLYIVATPIGNLEDITLRALRVLKEVDAIACEDTRVTKKLLFHYAIEKPLIAYHQHSALALAEKIVERVLRGENIAFVCDAGTPGVSDPGNILVERAVAREIRVVPIPGVSAVSALASAAGLDMQRFCFWGFVPHKKGRKTFFECLVASDIPVMYYDSVHRIVKNLELLSSISPETYVIVGRELTKQFEEIVRGSAQEVCVYFEAHPEKIKGEFTVIARTQK